MHLNELWTDVSNGFHRVDVSLADPPLHVGQHTVELRRRQSETMPAAEDVGLPVMVGVQPRTMVAGTVERIWLRTRPLANALDVTVVGSG